MDLQTNGQASNDRLIDKITERENEFVKVLDALTGEKQIFVYGAGAFGSCVASQLEKRGLKYKFMVDKQFCDGSENVFSLEEAFGAVSENEKVNVIIARSNYKPADLELFKDKIDRTFYYDVGCGNFFVESEYLTYGYVTEHLPRLEEVYGKLQDDKSKQTLAAFINQRISLKLGFVEKVRSHDPQYFEKEIINLGNDEVFVDCGAFNGDTAADFIRELKERGIDSYNSIISFEPDEENFKVMRERGLPNHKCIMKGASDKAQTIKFSTSSFSSGKMNGFADDNGEASIETDSIDNVLNGGKATFIKMDIEGSELAALHGAEKTIKKYKPKLAICIYHKREDLFKIPLYILSLAPDYKLYMRSYSNATFELVLYAI